MGWVPVGRRGNGRRRGRLVCTGVLCVLLLLPMVISLELLLMLLGLSGDVGVLIGEDAYTESPYLVVRNNTTGVY